MCRQVQTIHAPSPDCKRGELPRRGKRGEAPMRTGNPIWRPEPPDAPAHPGASVSRRCGVGARRWRGSGLHRRNPDNKRIDPGAGDASAFSAPGSVLYLSGHQPDFVYFPAFIRACFDEIRAVMLVQVDGSDGLLDDKCHHLSLPASMTTAHKSMRLTLSPPA